jgi:hypothetical protein
MPCKIKNNTWKTLAKIVERKYKMKILLTALTDAYLKV